MTREEIGQLLTVLWDSYPNTKARDPKGMLNTWEMAFADKDARVVFRSARLHIEDSPFFPTIADIKRRMSTAEWLVEREGQDNTKKIGEPTAPKKAIKAVTFCPLHTEFECVLMWDGICGGPEDNKCPFEGW